MKKDKKIISYKLIVICSLIVSVVSISNANAESVRGSAGSGTRDSWCVGKMNDCIDDIEYACGTGTDVATRLCESSETTACEGAYGGTSDCLNRPRVTGGGFSKSTLGVQDAYIAPDTNGGNRGPNKNTLVPQSGFVAPSPTNNGSTRMPAKPAAPMNKSLVAPLVVPTKKLRTMPTVTQPKMRTMSAPTIQPKKPVTKHRVEKSVKHNVATPAPSVAPQKKFTNTTTRPSVKSTTPAISPVISSGSKPTMKGRAPQPSMLPMPPLNIPPIKIPPITPPKDK